MEFAILLPIVVIVHEFYTPPTVKFGFLLRSLKRHVQHVIAFEHVFFLSSSFCLYLFSIIGIIIMLIIVGL